MFKSRVTRLIKKRVTNTSSPRMVLLIILIRFGDCTCIQIKLSHNFTCFQQTNGHYAIIQEFLGQLCWNSYLSESVCPIVFNGSPDTVNFTQQIKYQR